MKKHTLFGFVTALATLLLAACADDGNSSTVTNSNSNTKPASNTASACADGSACTNGLCSDGSVCGTDASNNNNNANNNNNNNGTSQEPSDDEKAAIEAACALADLTTSHDHCGSCGHACKDTEGCINGLCTTCDSTIDLYNDPGNCGACGHDCGKNANCSQGLCVCADGYSDCDNDGICETALDECECKKGDSRPCYDGIPESIDENGKPIGNCKEGVNYCEFNELYGYYWDEFNCHDQVLPTYKYTCASPTDDADCNGIPDIQQDEDGDGYAVCPANGKPADCCDNIYMCNTSMPERVNPGQEHDCYGNGIDDNCSGKVDDEPDYDCSQTQTSAECSFDRPVCSSASDYSIPTSSSTRVKANDAYNLAKALDICLDKVTKASGDSGIIEATLTASTSTTSNNLPGRQINIKDGMRDAYGNVLIEPRYGETFIILSSGAADDVYGTVTQSDESFGTSLGGLPAIYNSAHNGKLQSHSSCDSGNSMNDPVHFHLKIRAPQSAKGFSFDFRFFSREYPYFVCSKFNDFFLALLTDENGNAIGDTKDGNISFDALGNPISVNNAFFTTCQGSPCDGDFYNSSSSTKCPPILTCTEKNVCGALGEDGKDNTCPDGPDVLAAYYAKPYTSINDDKSLFDSDPKRGGGTAWLTTTAPVTGGEIFNLDFYIWDTGDHVYDSSVLIDNFKWSCDETTVGTGFAPPSENIL